MCKYGLNFPFSEFCSRWVLQGCRRIPATDLELSSGLRTLSCFFLTQGLLISLCPLCLCWNLFSWRCHQLAGLSCALWWGHWRQMELPGTSWKHLFLAWGSPVLWPQRACRSLSMDAWYAMQYQSADVLLKLSPKRKDIVSFSDFKSQEKACDTILVPGYILFSMGSS